MMHLNVLYHLIAIIATIIVIDSIGMMYGTYILILSHIPNIQCMHPILFTCEPVFMTWYVDVLEKNYLGVKELKPKILYNFYHGNSIMEGCKRCF